jgi:hypothetical protein
MNRWRLFQKHVLFTKLEIYVFYVITDDNIIQFGDVQVDDLVKKTGSIVYVQFVGGKHTQKDWYCTASTASSHDLQVSAVDVRFQRYGVSTGRCNGGLSHLYLNDSNHNSTIRCEDHTILGNYDTIFNSTESNITIQLHLYRKLNIERTPPKTEGEILLRKG